MGSPLFPSGALPVPVRSTSCLSSCCLSSGLQWGLLFLQSILLFLRSILLFHHLVASYGSGRQLESSGSSLQDDHDQQEAEQRSADKHHHQTQEPAHTELQSLPNANSDCWEILEILRRYSNSVKLKVMEAEKVLQVHRSLNHQRNQRPFGFLTIQSFSEQIKNLFHPALSD